MRRFVVIGRTATASSEFSLDDLPGSSGRLDVLIRCVRAALLVSHGVRRDTVIYLVLEGGPRAPRAVRIDGATVEYLRQDERSLAGTLKSMLAYVEDKDAFDAGTRGVSIARGGLDLVVEDLGAKRRGPRIGGVGGEAPDDENMGAFTPYVLDEGGADVRAAELDADNAVFFVGDHTGFAPETRARIDALGSKSISLGPISLHADDAIAIIGNELDRVVDARRGKMR